MKKIYMKPTIEVVDIELEQVIASSGPAINGKDLSGNGQLEEEYGDAMSKDRGSFLGF